LLGSAGEPAHALIWEGKMTSVKLIGLGVLAATVLAARLPAQAAPRLSVNMTLLSVCPLVKPGSHGSVSLLSKKEMPTGKDGHLTWFVKISGPNVNHSLGLVLVPDAAGYNGIGFKEVCFDGETSVEVHLGHIHVHGPHDVDVTSTFENLSGVTWPADSTHAVWVGAAGGGSPSSSTWPYTPDTRKVSGDHLTLTFTIVREPRVTRKYTLRVEQGGAEVTIDPDIINH
jgi:hypothetical protein